MKKILSLFSYLFLSTCFLSGAEEKRATKDGGVNRKESSNKKEGGSEKGEKKSEGKSTSGGKKSLASLTKLRGSLRRGSK